MNLESQKIIVNKSAQYITKQLSVIENYSKLMPESIDTFEVIDEKTFIFALKNMPKIKIKLEEVLVASKVILVSTSNSTPFTLTANIEADSDESCMAYFDFKGDFNAMMAMMIKGPISKFIETLAENLIKL